MIKFTKEEARMIIDDICWLFKNISKVDNSRWGIETKLFEKWTEKGWIEKSALEKARYFYMVTFGNMDQTNNIALLKNLYEDAIKEIQEDK